MWPGLIPSLLGMFQGQQAAGDATAGQAGGAAMGYYRAGFREIISN